MQAGAPGETEHLTPGSCAAVLGATSDIQFKASK
jgi:hypothetical protein